MQFILEKIQKTEFSASPLQSSMSHDPSEIILLCWFAEIWNISYNQYWKQLCCCFVETFQDTLMNKVQKN